MTKPAAMSKPKKANVFLQLGRVTILLGLAYLQLPFEFAGRLLIAWLFVCAYVVQLNQQRHEADTPHRAQSRAHQKACRAGARLRWNLGVDMRGGSVSRILSRPHRDAALYDHSSGPAVTGGIKLPTRVSRVEVTLQRYPDRDPRPAPRETPIRHCSRWGLPCRSCYQSRGGLLPHRFTLTLACKGGLFSVALSLGLPPPGVTRHRSFMESGLSSRRLSGDTRSSDPPRATDLRRAEPGVNREAAGKHMGKRPIGGRFRPHALRAKAQPKSGEPRRRCHIGIAKG